MKFDNKINFAIRAEKLAELLPCKLYIAEGTPCLDRDQCWACRSRPRILAFCEARVREDRGYMQDVLREAISVVIEQNYDAGHPLVIAINAVGGYDALAIAALKKPKP